MLFRRQRKTTNMIPLSLMLTLTATVQGASIPTAPPTTSPRTWHVAPKNSKASRQRSSSARSRQPPRRPSPVTRS